jgi:hypothetical protein
LQHHWAAGLLSPRPLVHSRAGLSLHCNHPPPNDKRDAQHQQRDTHQHGDDNADDGGWAGTAAAGDDATSRGGRVHT